MFDYEIIRSGRKTIAVEVKRDGKVIVRAPERLSQRKIESFVKSKSDWVMNHLKNAETDKQGRVPFTEREIQLMISDAEKDIPMRVSDFKIEFNVEVNRISIKCLKSRWGSCSSKRNLNFNCLLMLCPEDVRDYVVVHELCHLIEMNHSSRFWSCVEKIIPDYKARRDWLKKYGSGIISRLN